MSNITVPTAPDPKAPYFLEFEYSSHSGHHVAIGDVRTQESMADFSRRRDDSDDGTPERVREEAWVACCALNAAHMADPHALDHVEMEQDGDGGDVWLGLGIRPGLVHVLDRPKAAALGLALIQFAATGRLPGEDS